MLSNMRRETRKSGTDFIQRRKGSRRVLCPSRRPFTQRPPGGNQSKMFTGLTHARTRGQTPLPYLELSSAQNVYISSSNSVRFSYWVSTIVPLPRMSKNSKQNPNGTKCGAPQRSIPACGPQRLQLGLSEEGGWGPFVSLKRLQKPPRPDTKLSKHLETFAGPSRGSEQRTHPFVERKRAETWDASLLESCWCVSERKTLYAEVRVKKRKKKLTAAPRTTPQLRGANAPRCEWKTKVNLRLVP